MNDIIANESILDSIMGCDCDSEIKVMDSYLHEDQTSDDLATRIKTIFVCTGCGKMVSVSGEVDEIADISMVAKIRDMEDD